jgi:hypothetical protein
MRAAATDGAGFEHAHVAPAFQQRQPAGQSDYPATDDKHVFHAIVHCSKSSPR